MSFDFANLAERSLLVRTLSLVHLSTQSDEAYVLLERAQDVWAVWRDELMVTGCLKVKCDGVLVLRELHHGAPAVCAMSVYAIRSHFGSMLSSEEERNRCRRQRWTRSESASAELGASSRSLPRSGWPAWKDMRGDEDGGVRREVGLARAIPFPDCLITSWRGDYSCSEACRFNGLPGRLHPRVLDG